MALKSVPESATAAADYINAAVLVGYATADLRYTEEAASVNFVLTSGGLTGTGTLDLTLYLKDWSEASLKLSNTTGLVIANPTVGLYKLEDGSEFSDSKDTANFTGKVGPADNPDKVVHYYGKKQTNTATQLAAGTYDFTVTFTLANGKVAIYSSKVMILPNQETKADIGIPEVIGLPPTPPTDFKVGYIAPTNKDSDYYKAVFNWTDTSSSEMAFELDLFDVTGNQDVSPDSLNTETKWGGDTANSNPANIKTYSNSTVNPSDLTSKTTVFYGLKVDNGPSWYAGSLNRNNEFAIFYLELGKRYLARIRAVSAQGNSEYATTIVTTATGKPVPEGTAYSATIHSYAYSTPAETVYVVEKGAATAETASLGASEGNASTATNKVAVTAFNTHIINLFRVRYELNGGAFTSPSSLSSVYYFDQLTAGNPIMQPDGDAVITLADGVINSNPLIYNGTKYGTIVEYAPITVKSDSTSNGKPWTSWSKNSIDASLATTNDNVYPSVYTEINDSGTDTVKWQDVLGVASVTAGTTPIPSSVMIYRNVGTGAAPKYVLANIKTVPATTSADKYYQRRLEPYTDYSNIVLYANYTAATFGVTLKQAADYRIENNLGIKASLTGTEDPEIFTVATDSGTGELVTSSSAEVDVLSSTVTGRTYDETNSVTVTDEIRTDGKTYATQTGTGNADDPYVYTVVDLTITDSTATGYVANGTVVYVLTALGSAKVAENDYLIINRNYTTVVKAKYDNNTTAITDAVRTNGKVYATRTGTSVDDYVYTIVDLQEQTYKLADDTLVYKKTGTGNSATDYASTPVKLAVVRSSTDTYATLESGTYTDITNKAELVYVVASDANVYEETSPKVETTHTANSLYLTYSYNTFAKNGAAAFGTYDKVVVEVFLQGKKGGTSVGEYGPSSTAFTIPLNNFKTGTYFAKFKAYTAANNKTPYEYTIYFQLNE